MDDNDLSVRYRTFPSERLRAILDAHRDGIVTSTSVLALAPGFEPTVGRLAAAPDLGTGAHLAAVGEDLDDWVLPANAMEVVNSGATQTDPWQLYQDWLGLINRGLTVTPIGSSDSHDVARLFVGQGRTYIQVDDRDPGKIDVAAACKSLLEGRVMCGLGLLCQISVNEKSGPGDLAPRADEYRVIVDVLGPSWVDVSDVALYVNGVRTALRKNQVSVQTSDLPMGVRRRCIYRLDRLKHDAHVAAAAIGPGVKELYWPVAKPYQHDSPDGTIHVVGFSGAVRIDADGDGKYESPHEQARQLVEKFGSEPTKLVRELEGFDQAVIQQAASLLRRRGGAALDDTIAAAKDNDDVRRELLSYLSDWKSAMQARQAKQP